MFVGERERKRVLVRARSLHRRKDLKSERLGCLALGLCLALTSFPRSEMQQVTGLAAVPLQLHAR